MWKYEVKKGKTDPLTGELVLSVEFTENDTGRKFEQDLRYNNTASSLSIKMDLDERAKALYPPHPALKDLNEVLKNN